MNAKIAFSGVLIATLCVTSTGVLAGQTLTPPTLRQVPERTDGQPANDQHLAVTMSTFGAYDDNLISQVNGITDVRAQKSGSYSGLVGGATYWKRFRFIQIGAQEQSSLRYYPTLADLTATARQTTAQHSFGGGLGFQGRGTQLQFSQTLAYRPYFSIGQGLVLFSQEPGQLPPGGTFNDAIVERTAVSTASTVRGTQALGRTTSVTGSASYDDTTFQQDSTSSTFTLLGASLSQKVSRNLSLIAGYGRQQGMHRSAGGIDDIIRVHNIDAGVNYNRPVGRTRKTTIGFTTGSAIAKDDRDNSQFRFIGNARLNREFGRTWHATGAYDRGVSFVAGLPEPFFTDTVAADIAGGAGPRLDLAFNGRYSNGEMGFSARASDVKSYMGTARLRIGLSRTTGLTAEYVFYQYVFDGLAALPPGIPRNLHRQGLRFGFDLLLPIIR